MGSMRFEGCPDVGAAEADADLLADDGREILLQTARFCQALVDSDVDALRRLVDADATFKHMSGRTQLRDAYLADVASGALRYYAIAIDRPRIRIDGSLASISYTSVLDASAYGAKGIYRMRASHRFEKRGDAWLIVGA